LAVERATQESGLSRPKEGDTSLIVFGIRDAFGPGRVTAAGVSLFDVGDGHQAAPGVLSGVRPRVGKLRTHL
jgi:hypothetical protein